jgi:hypothetical protein
MALTRFAMGVACGGVIVAAILIIGTWETTQLKVGTQHRSPILWPISVQSRPEVINNANASSETLPWKGTFR